MRKRVQRAQCLQSTRNVTLGCFPIAAIQVLGAQEEELTLNTGRLARREVTISISCMCVYGSKVSRLNPIRLQVVPMRRKVRNGQCQGRFLTDLWVLSSRRG